MNFSDLIPHTKIANFSAKGDLIAVANGFSVQVYDTSNLSLIVQYSFPDIVSYIQWSDDSKYILVPIWK